MSSRPERRKRPGTLTVSRRVEEVVRIRLDGAEFWDVREYVHEKEREAGSAWERPPGGAPMCDDMVRRYMRKADRVCAQAARVRLPGLLRRHVAMRDNLYAKSVLAGDYRTALAVLADTDRLLGLYPDKRIIVEKQKAGSSAEALSDEELARIAARKPGRATGPGGKRCLRCAKAARAADNAAVDARDLHDAHPLDVELTAGPPRDQDDGDGPPAVPCG